MSMKTSVKIEQKQVLITFSGKLSFEAADKFKEQLQAIEQNNEKLKYVFNFDELQFVGSSGITSFIHTLREFNQRVPHRAKYQNVKVEFKKLIGAFDQNHTFEFEDLPVQGFKSWIEN